MGRKKKSEDRGHQPDARYNSLTVTKFICRMMWEGKKSTVTTIMYDAMAKLQEKAGAPALDAFMKAMDNVKPVVEVKSRRVGGATYQVPIEIREIRREALAMRWLIGAARKRSGRSMADRLAAEFTDAFNSTGTAVKKREDTHRMAEANKAFAHYRW
jgi:small subunit ribosomal protein S7